LAGIGIPALQLWAGIKKLPIKRNSVIPRSNGSKYYVNFRGNQIRKYFDFIELDRADGYTITITRKGKGKNRNMSAETAPETLRQERKAKRRREIIYAAAAAALFFILAELLLRALGFAFTVPPLEFRTAEPYRIFEKKGRLYSTKPEYVGLFRAQTFPASKPRSEFRIFVLGGSSIYNLGDMKPLGASLKRASRKKIRIINLGGNSFGSARLLVVLYDVVRFKPDLVVIYCGHNEFEEQFLKLRLEKDTPARRLDETLTGKSKVYQLMRFGIYRAGISFMLNRRKAEGHEIKPDFPPTPKTRINWDADRNKIFADYRMNLTRMVGLARENNADVVLATVAYNRMIGPNKPGNDDFKKGMAAYASGRFRDAFRLLSSGIDADRLPHRATDTSNRIVRGVASAYSVPLADVDRRIVDRAEHHVPGNDLFLPGDPVHLNKKGNIILQDLICETIIKYRLLR